MKFISIGFKSLLTSFFSDWRRFQQRIKAAFPSYHEAVQGKFRVVLFLFSVNEFILQSTNYIRLITKAPVTE